MMKTFISALLVFSLLILTVPAQSQVNHEFEKGRKYLYSGRYEEAVRTLKGYIKKKPSASAYYLLGYALYELGRHDEAHKYFQEAYLINPEFSPMK